MNIPPEIINKVKDRLAKLRWYNKVCDGYLYYIDEDYFDKAATYCHAWVNTAYSGGSWGGFGGRGGTEDTNTFVIANKLPYTCKRSSKDIEANKRLILWVAKECPFSEHVLNRDDDTFLTEHGLLILGGKGGASYVESMWMLKVLRMITEGGDSPSAWCHLVDGGVSPLIALAIAQQTREKVGKSFQYTDYEGHSTVFRKNNIPIVGMLTKNVNRLGGDTGKTFAGPSENLDVQKWFRGKMVDDGWGGLTLVKDSSGDQFVANALKYQKKFSKYLDGTCPSESVAKTKKPTKSTVHLEIDL